MSSQFHDSKKHQTITLKKLSQCPFTDETSSLLTVDIYINATICQKFVVNFHINVYPHVWWWWDSRDTGPTQITISFITPLWNVANPIWGSQNQQWSCFTNGPLKRSLLSDLAVWYRIEQQTLSSQWIPTVGVWCKLFHFNNKTPHYSQRFPCLH